MEHRILAGFKQYNANSRDANVGDCVKRSLAIAYGLDYDEVTNSLNAIKRAKHLDKFNVPSVFDEFIRRHGVVRVVSWEDMGLGDDPITVSGFCDMFDTGVYILLCGKTPRRSTHMVAVLNGDFWDSWDCSSYYVSTVYEISSDADIQIEEVYIDDIADEVTSYIQAKLSTANTKMPWASFEYLEPDIVDPYSLQQTISCILDPDQLTVLRYARYYTPSYTYTIKINPRKSLEENVAILKAKLWTRVREWAYSVRKEVEADVIGETTARHPEFRGDASLLAKLPEWCRGLVTYIDGNGDPEYDERLTVVIEALADDPLRTREPRVEFRANNITDIRRYLQLYYDKFYRQGIDY